MVCLFILLVLKIYTETIGTDLIGDFSLIAKLAYVEAFVETHLWGGHGQEFSKIL